MCLFMFVVTKEIIIVPKHSLLELVGILSKKEVSDLRKHIKARRKASRRRLDRIYSRLESY